MSNKSGPTDKDNFFLSKNKHNMKNTRKKTNEYYGFTENSRKMVITIK